jgi:P22_AR N-terminal domain
VSDKEEQESQALIPLVQGTILFNGHPLVVVRLPDGQPGVVLRWICENLHISPAAQVERIKRTEVIADDLVYVRVQTDGGPQIMPTLILHAAPYWLATIDTRRMDRDDPRRLEILNYQRHAVDALYAWAQSPKALVFPTSLVPAEPISKPSPPADDADLDAWREYHRQMLMWLDWQQDIEAWRGSVESRLEGLEEVTNLIPEILERLGPHTLAADHQRAVQMYVQQLHELTGTSYGVIYDQLKTAFKVPRYTDIPELDWPQVVKWFKGQLELKGRREH